MWETQRERGGRRRETPSKAFEGRNAVSLCFLVHHTVEGISDHAWFSSLRRIYKRIHIEVRGQASLPPEQPQVMQPSFSLPYKVNIVDSHQSVHHLSFRLPWCATLYLTLCSVEIRNSGAHPCKKSTICRVKYFTKGHDNFVKNANVKLHMEQLPYLCLSHWPYLARTWESVSGMNLSLI